MNYPRGYDSYRAASPPPSLYDVFPCPACDGLGYTLSDPDAKQLVCPFCDGWYGEAERAARVDAAADECLGEDDHV